MIARLFALGMVSGLCLGCTSGPQTEAKGPSGQQVASCVQPFDSKLAETVAAQPGPYRVRIDFASPPPEQNWLRWGIAECVGTTCSAWVEREKLYRLCRDTNVRDIQSWQ